jgi:dTMP kinase
MDGVFITFEGTEGSGKSTQIQLVAERLIPYGREVLSLREPGGTPLGEEIRHLLKHSPAGRQMYAETELLLMNAARAQLVREVIRPALARGAIVLCDRFYDSTVVYQGYGRGIDLVYIERLTELAAGNSRPHLTLLLRVPLFVSEQRREIRGLPDRFEEADRAFFQRVEQGYDALAESAIDRLRSIDATQSIDSVHAEVWRWIEPLVCDPPRQGEQAYKSIGEYREGPLT